MRQRMNPCIDAPATDVGHAVQRIECRVRLKIAGAKLGMVGALVFS
jgi:hypothetical protein